MSAKDLSLKSFSELADIPYRTLQNYILSGREPSSEALVKLHTHLGINLNWLMLGEGKMFVDEVDGNQLTEKEIELLLAFKSCNETTQRKINLAVTAISQDID